MATRTYAFVAIGITALVASGCSSVMNFGRDEPVARAPEALPAAPAGSVTGSTLAPPPGAMTSGLEPQQPATGLAALGSPAQGTMSPAAGAGAEVGRADLLGGWKISAAGDNCQLFMTLTTWAGGYRASTRGCTSAPLQGISAWNMEGRQVQLLNDSGATVARLYPTSRTEFAGQTEGGGPVTVIR